VPGATQSSGITQPDTTFPLFEFSTTPPANAEEIVAFDATNPGNWNVGQYKLIGSAAPAPGPPIIIKTPTLVPSGLRTVKFKGVVDSILRRHGFDPLGDAVTHDTVRAIVEHINERMITAFNYWEWPQLTMLEERAFRTTWTNTLQFYRVNADGFADEVFYNGNYYQVLQTAPSDPPVGTPPTNTTYWTTLALSDRYISYNQVNRSPIGGMIAIFDSDPRLSVNHYAQKIPFRPTERECTVTWAGSGATVWAFFQVPQFAYTMVPFVTGRTYASMDLIFHPADGECYMALQDAPTGDPTAQPTQWIKVPMPEMFRRYIVAGAYADGLRETDVAENDPVKLQIRNTKIQIADAEAESYLQGEVDALVAQGQTFRYGQFRPAGASFQGYWPVSITNAA
jgi:hypothetical protein